MIGVRVRESAESKEDITSSIRYFGILDKREGADLSLLFLSVLYHDMCR